MARKILFMTLLMHSSAFSLGQKKNVSYYLGGVFSLPGYGLDKLTGFGIETHLEQAFSNFFSWTAGVGLNEYHYSPPSYGYLSSAYGKTYTGAFSNLSALTGIRFYFLKRWFGGAEVGPLISPDGNSATALQSAFYSGYKLPLNNNRNLDLMIRLTNVLVYTFPENLPPYNSYGICSLRVSCSLFRSNQK